MLRTGFRHAARRSLAAAPRAASYSVYAWGTGAEGQLGHLDELKDSKGTLGGYREPAPRRVELDFSATAVEAGAQHCLAIDDAGDVWSWGAPEYGKLGHGATSDKAARPQRIEALRGAKAVSAHCGDFHSAVVTEAGEMYTWGWGGGWTEGYGLLGHGNGDSLDVPKRVERLVAERCVVAQAGCGESHTVALSDDGELYSWGVGEYGRIGNGSTGDVLEPETLEAFEDSVLTHLAVGKAYTIVTDSDGVAWVWGRNDEGQLGLGGGLMMDVYSMESMPVRVTSEFHSGKVEALAAGHSHSAAITDSGDLYHWGMKAYIQPHRMQLLEDADADAEAEAEAEVAAAGGDAKDNSGPPLSDARKRAAKVTCGGYCTAVVDTEAQLWTFGSGFNLGVLGHGDTKARLQPTRVEAFDGKKVLSVSAGFKSMLALVDDGN